jgi:hypothetical protein
VDESDQRIDAVIAMASGCTIVVAHRSHAQAIVDAEVSLVTYPHSIADGLDIERLALLYAAVSPAMDLAAARLALQATPEAEDAHGVPRMWRLPDDFSSALVGLDAVARHRILAQLNADRPVSDPNRHLEAALTALIALSAEATSSGRELLVLIV